MKEYCIEREELFKWCSIPADQLESHPASKVKLTIRDTRQEAMRIAGNMMADEVIRNNAAGKPTSWVLPSGPADQFDTFINRVNTERISLKNLTIFHMDYVLDFNSRVYPLGDYYESAHGRMLYRFYNKIDPELNVPESQRIWPRIEDQIGRASCRERVSSPV